MPQTLLAFPAEYDEDITTRIYQGISQFPMIWKEYNDVSATKKYIESLTSYSGLGPVGQWKDGEDVPMDDILKLGDQTMTQVFYGMGFAITRKAVDYGEGLKRAAQLSAALSKSVGQTLAQSHANTLNNGFTTTFSHFGTKALIATDHTTAGAGTRANELSAATALTPAGWEATLLLGLNWVNYRGLNDPFMVNKMIIPPALRMMAIKLQQSVGEPDTTDNDVNVHRGDFSIIMDPLLSSSTAYFGQAPGHGLISLHGKTPTPFSFLDEPSRSIVHAVENDFVNSVLHPDGMVGSLGA